MRESVLRLLNRDGTFNVARGGLPLFKSLNLYQAFLSASWLHFNLIFIGFYLLINLLFAFLYYLCGPDALTGSVGLSHGERFIKAFFFSLMNLPY